MKRTPKQICHLLRNLRDWATHPRPFNAFICLITLHEAGELGLTAKKLADRMGRTPDFIASTLAPWIKAGLVEFNPQLRRSKKDPSFYRITPEGALQAEALFKEQLTPAAASA